MQLQFVTITSLDENNDKNEYMSIIIGGIH